MAQVESIDDKTFKILYFKVFRKIIFLVTLKKVFFLTLQVKINKKKYKKSVLELIPIISLRLGCFIFT